MPQNTAAGAGTRIGAYRRLCRLTQTQLANKANISYSLLVKVEQGRRPASASLTAAVARALGVPITTFTGQPYVTDHAHDRLDGPLADLRASLENWDLALDEVPVRGAAEIGADVHLVLDARRASNYAKITAMAPPLIDELVQVSQTATGHVEEQAHQMLVHVYRSAYDVAYNLGLSDLVALLLSRMDYSVRRGNDPYLMALHHYMRAYATFTTGRLEVGQAIISRALDIVETGVRAEEVPALCSAGNLRLRAAMLACRLGDEDEARGELAEARRLGDLLGREVTGGRDDGPHVQSFGATNVAIHARPPWRWSWATTAGRCNWRRRSVRRPTTSPTGWGTSGLTPPAHNCRSGRPTPLCPPSSRLGPSPLNRPSTTRAFGRPSATWCTRHAAPRTH